MGLKNLGDEGRIDSGVALHTERPCDVGVEGCPDIVPIARTRDVNGAVSVIGTGEIVGDLHEWKGRYGTHLGQDLSLSVDNRNGYA